MIADWARSRGDVIVETVQELASGALPKGLGAGDRKGLFGAFTRVLASADIAGLVVVRLDRLCRDMVSAQFYVAELTRAGASFAVVCEPELSFTPSVLSLSCGFRWR